MLNTQTDFPLSKLTTLAIGGPAKEFLEVKTKEQLIEAIEYAKQNNLEYLVIGGGSNLLVADEGVDKLIIKNSISGIEQNGNFLVVKSGTVLQDLVNFSIENNLVGLQKLTGIPGTVGGAIYGNAGAYGQSISDHLVEITVLDPSTVIPAQAGIQLKDNLNIKSNILLDPRFREDDTEGAMVLKKEACGFDYRFSNFKKNGYIILGAKFELEPGDTKTMTEEAANTLTQRAVKYPPGIKCPGSFFKNIIASSLPSEILAKIPQEKIVYGKLPAGVLLEEVGARGAKLGNIEIAPYHANLFINKGNGSANDFYNLAKEYAQKVKEKFSIQLEPEVQLINLHQL